MATDVAVQIQWSEWDASAMTSGGFLASASAYPAYLGKYPANTFPNPIASSYHSGVQNNQQTFFTQWDPSAYVPGSLGVMEYYSYWDSPWKDSNKFEIDYAYLMLQYDSYLSSYDAAWAELSGAAYISKVAAFNAVVN